MGSGHLGGDSGAVVSVFWHHSTKWGLATVGVATAIAIAAAAATMAESSWIFFHGRRAARFSSLVARLLRSFLQEHKVSTLPHNGMLNSFLPSDQKKSLLQSQTQPHTYLVVSVA